MTRNTALCRARDIAIGQKQDTNVVVCNDFDDPPEKAFYPATDEEAETFFNGCTISARVEYDNGILTNTYY